MNENKIIIIGHLDMNGWIDHMKRVYDPNGIAPTISTCGGATHNRK